MLIKITHYEYDFKKSGKASLRSAADSPKTLIARAKREIPGFTEHFAKFEEQVTIGGYSSSTIFTLTKLNINPDACPKCKIGFMEVIETCLPQRGPPLLKMKPNTQFLAP